MTRTQYLHQLEKYLKRLPEEDYQDTMDYFNEYFDELGPDKEAQAIAELGSPREAAREILASLYEKKVEAGEKKTQNLLLIVCLSILAAPMALPLAITILCLFITALIFVVSFFLLLASAWISLIAVGFAAILATLNIFPLAWTSGLLFLGIGLTCLAIALLGTQATIILGRKTVTALVHLVQKYMIKGDRHEII